jgi:hypothetical protein
MKMSNTDIEKMVKERLEKDFVRVDRFDTEKGGIYVETTEDPRGWMLGDKTRKIYVVSELDTVSLADLFVVVVPNNNDGSEVKVHVYYSRNIGRMLLSENDDVGSSIQYAQIEEYGPTELVAKMGSHICVESLMRGNWIRVHVYPGVNILDMMKFSESWGKGTKETLVDLVDRYHGMEEDIDALLSRMERHGKSCDCEEPLVFKQIFDGKFEEILQTCLTCGGTVER